MNKLFLIAAFALIMSVSLAADPANPNCADPGTDAASCTTCDDGYGIVSTTNGGNTVNTCSKCTVDNCATCQTAPATCQTCNSGYGLVANKCTKCSADTCTNCDGDIKKCKACKAGYALKDAEGAALDTCTACANGCAACDQVDDSCAGCPSGHAKNSTTSTNVFCCSNTNCTSCSDVNTCTACATGLTLDSTKGTCNLGFKTGASLTIGAVLSVALFSLFF